VERHQRLSSLSKREREILFLLACGRTNREIGGELDLSEKTVRNHVSSVLAKLGVHHRTEAAVYALGAGIGHAETPTDGNDKER
jgi:DNA-binding NarL/FixJ family response regulator